MAKQNSTLSFMQGLVKELDDEYINVAADGLSSAEFSGFIDSGSLSFNGLVSGSMFGGIPDNKAVVLAGESATGKTYFTLGICKHFLDNYKDSFIFYFDTEAAVTNQMLADRGIDPARVITGEPETIQQFRTKAQNAHRYDRKTHQTGHNSTVGTSNKCVRMPSRDHFAHAVDTHVYSIR
jgi:RecA/RadA recombinase